MRMLRQGACLPADEALEAELCVTVPASPAAATALRRAVRALEGYFGSGKGGEVDLLVTELVTNGFKHARSEGANRITLAARVADGTLHIAVTDSGEGFSPSRRAAPRTEPGGWGLMLVEGIADRWGVETAPTTVWFELAGGHEAERLAA